MRNDDALKFAYLAGVIDSDGFISAHRHKRQGMIYCAPLIGISGTSFDLAVALSDLNFRNPPKKLSSDRQFPPGSGSAL